MYVWYEPAVWGSELDEGVGNLAGGKRHGGDFFHSLSLSQPHRRANQPWGRPTTPPPRPPRPREMSVNSSREPARPS